MVSSVIEKWDEAAKLYTSMQEDSSFASINKKLVAERFARLSDKKVLDLGCGYGWYTDFFSSVGAEVIGCDGSAKMLALAKEKYPSCVFECCDIEKTMPYDNNCFDLVFCNQVIMDIKNFEGLFEEAYRILKAGGIFYFSIVHPAFYDCRWVKDENGFSYAKIMTKYLSEYNFENEFWGRTTHYHRTMSKYLNTATQMGFRLVHLGEPISYDGVTRSNEFPLFLFVELEKP